MIQRCGGGRTVFLGDSINDTMAAKNAGIPSIAVSFGFLMQPIEELMADLVIHHYDELIPRWRTGRFVRQTFAYAGIPALCGCRVDSQGTLAPRSEERRVGKEGVSLCRSRCVPYN